MADIGSYTEFLEDQAFGEDFGPAFIAGVVVAGRFIVMNGRIQNGLFSGIIVAGWSELDGYHIAGFINGEPELVSGSPISTNMVFVGAG